MKLNLLNWVKTPPLLVADPAPVQTLEIVQDNGNREIVKVEREDKWGMFPLLSLVVACGLLIIAFGFANARKGADWGSTLFWVGLLTIYIPTAVRLIGARASRTERIMLVGLVGLSVFAVKVLHSPIFFTFHDEFVHWRTANDILRTGHLFNENPVIPVSPLYPGLQLVTTSLMSQTGIELYGAAQLVIGLAKLVLILSLFFFFENISNSARLAGVATLIYMCNPTFMFFGSQYAYESLSLPMAALVIFAVSRRNQANVNDRERMGLNLAAILGILTVTMTHHLTSYALAAFLGLWAVVAFVHNMVNKLAHRGIAKPSIKHVMRQSVAHFKDGDWRDPVSAQPHYERGPGMAALLAIVACAIWLVYVANFTIGYLAPVLRDAIIEVVKLIAGESSGRQLFKGSVGQVAPLWEQLSGFGAVGLLMLALPFGLLYMWRNMRHNALALTLGIAALAYPATLGMRLTTAGWEVSNRTSEFIFIPVGFLAAYGLAYIWLSHRPGFEWKAAMVACLTVIFLGGVLVGWPPFARIPGNYLVAADSRSIEFEGIATAQWARQNLPKADVENQLPYRMATDRINGLLMLSHGQQRTVMNVGDGVNVGTLFLAKELWPVERGVLERGRIRWVTVDYRLTKSLPMLGVYFEAGEPNSNNHKEPIDPYALGKFDREQNVNRLYDSGNVIIFDAGRVSGVIR